MGCQVAVKTLLQGESSAAPVQKLVHVPVRAPQKHFFTTSVGYLISKFSFFYSAHALILQVKDNLGSLMTLSDNHTFEGDFVGTLIHQFSKVFDLLAFGVSKSPSKLESDPIR